MYLLINTVTADKIILYLVMTATKYCRLSVPVASRQTERLLPAIFLLLKRQGKKISTLRGVGVVNGPGSFTALRVGAVTANTLGYALKLPVVGVPQAEDGALVNDFYHRLKQLKKFKVVLPQYGREPNITRPRAQV